MSLLTIYDEIIPSARRILSINGHKLGYVVESGGGPPAILTDGNTKGWYDYSDLTTLTLRGSYVSAWGDKLLGANTLLQATEDKQPLLTSTGILFDAIDDWIRMNDFTSVQPEYLYLVIRNVTHINNKYMLDGNNINRMSLYTTTTSGMIQGYVGGYTGAVSLTVGNFGIVRYFINTTSSKLQVNEDTPWEGTLTTQNGFGLILGASGGYSSHSNIEVKEVILRNIVDTPTNEAAIYNYLKIKYAL